jgi:hypothetical protein
MTKGTIFFGIFLIFLGVGSYLLTGRQSVTAMIPSFFGLIILPMGLLALVKPQHKRHFLHVSAAVSLLAILGTVKGLWSFVLMLGGQDVLRPQAVTVQAIMCLCSSVYLGFCVRSFVLARILRTSENKNA